MTKEELRSVFLDVFWPINLPCKDEELNYHVKMKN